MDIRFSPGDIVIIDHYPLPEAIGLEAEVLHVNTTCMAPEPWYVLMDSSGRRRAAAQKWLRRRTWDELQALLGLSETRAEA